MDEEAIANKDLQVGIEFSTFDDLSLFLQKVVARFDGLACQVIPAWNMAVGPLDLVALCKDSGIHPKAVQDVNPAGGRTPKELKRLKAAQVPILVSFLRESRDARRRLGKARHVPNTPLDTGWTS